MWQTPLLPFQLFSQSVMVASGVLLVLNGLFVHQAEVGSVLAVLFPLSLVVNLLLSLAGRFNSFASEVALLGYREMTRGRFRNHFWWGGIVLGHLVPLLLVFAINPALAVLIVACVVVGLFFYEYALVMAPQYIPNS